MSLQPSTPVPSAISTSTYTPSPSSPHAQDGAWPVKWKIEVNARYQKVADLLISLATGALILPPIFLREYLGVRDEPLAMFLNGWAYTSVVSFGLTILLGIAFHYASVKWIKQAWGQRTLLRPQALERLMDVLFGGMIAFFLTGIACFLNFVASA